MSFSRALDLMLAGQPVRRECWNEVAHVRFVEGKLVMVHRDDRDSPRNQGAYPFDQGELLADDWEIAP